MCTDRRLNLTIMMSETTRPYPPTLAWTSAADRSSGLGDIISAIGEC